jgi:hypothetical protein
MTTKDKKIPKENIHYPPDNDRIDVRVALLEHSIATINDTLDRLENSFNRLETKMDVGFSEIRKEMKSDFRWLLTIIAGLGAIMAHGFHWF